MKKKTLWLSMIVLVMSAFLVACSGGSSTEPKDEEKAGDDGKPQEGGTLTYALDSEFKGILNYNFYDIATDAEILQLFDDGLINYDENLKPTKGIADWKTDDNQNYTFTFEKGVKWHNGEELTVHDWVFAIETIATLGGDHHRWSNVNTIEGAVAFNEGKADSISGLEVVDDYTLKIKFDKARVNNLENVWAYPLSRKEFEGIAPADMAASEQVRSKPVGTGPFKVTKVVPGESVELERNEDYWQGKPLLDKIIVKVIDASLTTGELKNSTVDMVPFHPSILGEIEALDNVEVIRYPGLSYYYVGFKLGTFKDGKVVMDKPKYSDKKLRQAMLYAINREEWVKAYFSGLGQPIDSPIPTNHWIAADQADLPNEYTYDPEKAKTMLDEAGYKDTNGDGFREDPKGEEFVVKFSHYATGNPTFESRAQAITQYWNDIGLKTELTMPDVNLYYDQIDKDDPAIEVFFGGWSTGTDPDPLPLWGNDTLWNNPRWVNEDAQKLLEDAIDMSVVGTDTEKRKGLYTEWQKIFNEEVPALPILELDEVMAVNERVQGVKYNVAGQNSAHEWWVKQ